MCTGIEALTVASTAASLGGKLLGSSNEAKNAQAKINARNAAAQQEQQRQRIFQQSNDAAINNTLQDMSSETQQQSFGDLVAKREQAYTENAPPAAEFATISESTPQVVKSDLAKRVSDAISKSKAQAKALAKVGATGDVFQNNGLSINQAANSIGTTNGMARGSLTTNITEQTAAANNAGNKSSLFGDLLSGAGALGTAYSAQNGGFDSLGNSILTGVGVRKTATLPPGVQGPVGTYNDWGAITPW